MVDIFISYANEDGERAGKMAQAFGTMGWSVWWDRRIIVGQRYDQTIERELETAKSVVVLWSKHSTGSEWVRNEAAVGARRGVLVPAMLERVQLPLEFSRKQTADLTGWNGDPSSSGFQELCEGVAAVLGSSFPRQRRRPVLAFWHDRRWMWIGMAIVVLGIGYEVSRLATRHAIREAEPASAAQARDAEGGELANVVVGTYLGDIIADPKGSSRSDVFVTVTRIDRTKVRVTSNNPRIGTLELDLTRSGDNLFNFGGDSTLIAYIKKNPPALELTTGGGVAYRGTKTDGKSTRHAPR